MARKPTKSQQLQQSSTIQDIPLSDIREAAANPRGVMDEAALQELAASIYTVGVLQPIIVRHADDGLEVVAGHRRLAAASLAGLKTIPCIVRHDISTTIDQLEVMIVENLQREDLSPIDEARAYAQLRALRSESVDDIAARIGKSKSYVFQRLQLLKLIPAAADAVARGELSAAHGIALARLADARQVVMLPHALDDSLAAFEARLEAAGDKKVQTKAPTGDKKVQTQAPTEEIVAEPPLEDHPELGQPPAPTPQQTMPLALREAWERFDPIQRAALALLEWEGDDWSPDWRPEDMRGVPVAEIDALLRGGDPLPVLTWLGDRATLPISGNVATALADIAEEEGGESEIAPPTTLPSVPCDVEVDGVLYHIATHTDKAYRVSFEVGGRMRLVFLRITDWRERGIDALKALGGG